MRPILIILFVCSTGIVCASNEQDSIRSKFGIELNTSASLSSICVTPTFSYSFGQKSKMTFGIGSSLWNALDYSGIELQGVEFQFAYKYFPNGRNQKVNFFFQGVVKHFGLRYEASSGYKEIRQANEILFGYGLEVPIGKKFYFLKDMAIGEIIFFDTSSNGFDFWNFYPNIYLRFGFGFRF
jgi:hypothetical protein